MPSFRASLIAAVATAATTAGWRFMTFHGFTNDQYVHLAVAQQLLLGDRPVRDFSDPGMPLMYWLSAGVMRASTSVGAEWMLTTTAFALGAAATLIAATRLAGSMAPGIVVTMLTVVMSPRDYSYPKVVLYGLAAVALVSVAAHPSRTRLALLGALTAVAFLFRHDHGLYIGAAALAAVALSGIGDQGSGSRRRILTLAGTTMLVLMPWLIYILLNDPVSYVRTGMEFARAEAEVTVLDAWPRVGLSDMFTRDNGAAWLFWLFWTLPVICAALAIRRRLRRTERWPGEASAVIALAFLAAAVNAGFLRDVLTVRIPDAAVPAAILGGWCLAVAWHPVKGRPPITRRALAIAVLVVTAGAVYSVANVADNMDRAGLVTGGSVRASAERALGFLRSSHREIAPSRFSRALLPFFEYTDRCTASSDRLLITGLFPDILVLAGRGFAGGSIGLALGHASPDRQSDMMARLRSRPPLFFLLLDSYEGFRERFDQIERYIAAEFRLMAEWPVPEAGSIQIFVQRSRRPTSTDETTGFPCFPSP